MVLQAAAPLLNAYSQQCMEGMLGPGRSSVVTSACSSENVKQLWSLHSDGTLRASNNRTAQCLTAQVQLVQFHSRALRFMVSTTARYYSSVYQNDAVGTGHAQSALNSPGAWRAQTNAAGQWMVMDAGEPIKMSGVITVGFLGANAPKKSPRCP